MGPFEIILVTPVRKVVWTVRQVLNLALVEQFGLEGARKAFVFAQGLGMRGARMANPDPEAHAPAGQGRKRTSGPIAPGSPGSHQPAEGQASAPEGGEQVRLPGGGLFIRTGLEPQGEPGTVIQDRQGGGRRPAARRGRIACSRRAAGR